jgi:hypothetical protein
VVVEQLLRRQRLLLGVSPLAGMVCVIEIQLLLLLLLLLLLGAHSHQTQLLGRLGNATGTHQHALAAPQLVPERLLVIYKTEQCTCEAQPVSLIPFLLPSTSVADNAQKKGTKHFISPEPGLHRQATFPHTRILSSAT